MESAGTQSHGKQINDTGSSIGLLGGVPHGGPACKYGRLVVFATAEKKKKKKTYDQYSQYTATSNDPGSNTGFP